MVETADHTHGMFAPTYLVYIVGRTRTYKCVVCKQHATLADDNLAGWRMRGQQKD
jgi:hypothetical protein